jgi:hypothetical protein
MPSNYGIVASSTPVQTTNINLTVVVYYDLFSGGSSSTSSNAPNSGFYSAVTITDADITSVSISALLETSSGSVPIYGEPVYITVGSTTYNSPTVTIGQEAFESILAVSFPAQIKAFFDGNSGNNLAPSESGIIAVSTSAS